jgi:ADP-heptose:LPS heptosyltransferase
MHLYHRRFPGTWLLRPRLVRELRRENYDRAYVFESHPHYRELVAEVAPAIHELANPAGSAHYSARCMDAVGPTLPRPMPHGWVTLPVTEAGRSAAAAYLSDHGLHEDDWLVGLHLTFSESSRGPFGSGRGRKHREWSVAAGAELAKRLYDYGSSQGVAIRPVLDVLPQERKMAEAFGERVGEAVTVLCGPPEFERYKAVLQRLRLLVAPNTGPMHVAAAVGTPVVALFSGWSPEDCGPFVPPGRAITLRAEDTPQPELGLSAISAEAAFAACRPFLP